MPRPDQVNRLQHALNAGRPLLPCTACGDARPPLVGKPRGQRRVVQCIGCGRFFMAAATATDAEIAELWDERARGVR